MHLFFKRALTALAAAGIMASTACAATGGMPDELNIVYVKAPFNLQNMVLKERGMLEKAFEKYGTRRIRMLVITVQTMNLQLLDTLVSCTDALRIPRERAWGMVRPEQVLSPTWMLPLSGRRFPDKILISVDLPEPLSPTMAVMAPARTSRETPSRACICPNRLVRHRTSRIICSFIIKIN